MGRRGTGRGGRAGRPPQSPGLRTCVDQLVALQVPNAVEDAPADLTGVDVPGADICLRRPGEAGRATATSGAHPRHPGDRDQGAPWSTEGARILASIMD